MRTVRVAGEEVKVQPPGEPIKVLGLMFSFDGDQSGQAREMIGRVRAAFGQHRELLRGKAGWANKMYAIKTLLEGVFAWVAGALYWAGDDLGILNTLQLHVLRDACDLRRRAGEEWFQWNQRTRRYLRAWLHKCGHERWSTKIRKLQFNLAGHLGATNRG